MRIAQDDGPQAGGLGVPKAGSRGWGIFSCAVKEGDRGDTAHGPPGGLLPPGSHRAPLAPAGSHFQ